MAKAPPPPVPPPILPPGFTGSFPQGSKEWLLYEILKEIKLIHNLLKS